MALSSGRSLLGVIGNILDLSKIEAGKVALESVDFDLRRAIGDAAGVWRAQASAKGLEFGLQMAPDSPALVRGDPHRLRQVLDNLIGNAIKFTERGEVSLLVEAVRTEGSKRTLRFTAADTGIGLRPDQAARLFSPFVQADASTTRKYGGSGLGLAICKQLVELMGGQIGIESREGEGSTFRFTAVFETAAEADLAPADGAAAKPAGARRGARILVADDDLTNRTVALAQMGKLGHIAEAAVNGAKALEAMRQGRYDLVLMDCEMPVMDGYEATRRIRELDGPRVPVVALTSHASTGDRDRCLREGMDDVLTKPVDMGRLAETLAKWLPERGGAGEAVAVFDAEEFERSKSAIERDGWL